ncbi:MAG: ABC transporter permease subunit, partial [Proteocatella sp.]
MEIKTAANKITNKKNREIAYRLGLLLIIVMVWQYTAVSLGSELLLPMPKMVMEGFFICLTDPEILSGLFITLSRVLKGFFWALTFGLPLGFMMGFSKTVENVLSPLIDSVRQVPIMAWVPLTIVWFGIGDGPTIFLIAFSGVFPIILNT